ncbi:MAG TPA: hypothetical protein VG097_16350 [Gemmata sp.]|nr:hypothetical protein [Gemmata sp.]
MRCPLPDTTSQQPFVFGREIGSGIAASCVRSERTGGFGLDETRNLNLAHSPHFATGTMSSSITRKTAKGVKLPVQPSVEGTPLAFWNTTLP